MSPFGRGREGRGFGRHRFGGFQPGIADGSAFINDLYYFEVWDKTDTRLARLPQWTSAQWTDIANLPNIFEFTYPFDDEHKDLLVYPNRIYLYDRVGTQIRGFTISVVTPTRTQEGQEFVSIKCYGLMAQLGTEMISSYNSVTAGDTTVGEILDALFDLQARTNIDTIRRGRIDNAIRSLSRELIIQNTSILQALRSLQKTVGGIMDVSPTGTFTWKRETGAATGQQIRINKNMPALNVTRDYTGIFTRVVAYGKGPEPDERLTVTVNNASAQSTYGVIPLYQSWPEVDNADVLGDLGNKLLREVSRPVLKLQTQTIDLSLADDARLDFTHEALEVGSRKSFIDTSLGEIHDARIAKIVRDLFVPEAVSIDIQNPDDVDEVTAYAEPEPDIFDDLVALIDRVNTITNRDILGFANGGFPTSYLASDVSTWDVDTNTGTLDNHLNDTDIITQISNFLENIANNSTFIDNVVNNFTATNISTIVNNFSQTDITNIVNNMTVSDYNTINEGGGGNKWVEL